MGRKSESGQLSLFDSYRMSITGCGDCICVKCLYYNSGRECEYGTCYDDMRAKYNPYPYETRKSWSDWNKPGEQEHWCRGGTFYRCDQCDKFVPYDDRKTQVLSCLEATVLKYQDGYQWCPLVEPVGCTECYRRFEERYADG